MQWTKWSLKNSVPINLITLFVVFMGLCSAFLLQREMFPKITDDKVNIVIPLENRLTPEQVDLNISEIIYSQIQAVEGVKEITSISAENSALIQVSIAKGYDTRLVKEKIEEEVARINSLPAAAKKPSITQFEHVETPIFLAVYADELSSMYLRDAAEKIIRDMKKKKIITKAHIVAKKDYEIEISLASKIMQAKDLTYLELAQQLQSNNLERSVGLVKSPAGNTFLRSSPRKKSEREIGKLPIRFPNGEWQSLSQLSGHEAIKDGFADNDTLVKFNNQNAIIIGIDQADNEDSISLCEKVRHYSKTANLAQGIKLRYFLDHSSFIQDRLNLIKKNGFTGLLLVVMILSLFLEWKIAFWVAAGIAFSLIGSLAIMLQAGATINMISLFGFLLTLGIIVDDAIVVGESFFSQIEKGKKAIDAALATIDEVFWPVFAMMLTTISAFIPLLYLEGMMGKFISALPFVVIAALVLSLFESLFILPIHLAHHCGKTASSFMRLVHFILYPWISLAERGQKKLSKVLDQLSTQALRPLLSFCLDNSLASIIFLLSLSILILGLLPAGIVGVSFFPEIDVDFEIAKIEFEEEADLSAREAVASQIGAALMRADKKVQAQEGQKIVKNFFLWSKEGVDSHKAEMLVELFGAQEGRKMSSQDFRTYWREEIPSLPGLVNLSFQSGRGGPQAAPIEIDLSSENAQELQQAEEEIIRSLDAVSGVVDIQTSNRKGNRELSLEVKDSFKNLVSEKELLDATQSIYQGSVIDRFYRHGDEVRVIVRAPLDERRQLETIENFKLANGFSLGQLAKFSLKRGVAEVKRINGQRTLTISAELDKRYKTSASDLRQSLREKSLAKLHKYYPTVSWSFGGEAKEGSDTVKSMLKNFLPAILTIYFILATVFKSYTQPFIIMIAIPFSFLGAIIGHFILGFSFNLMSGFGIIALTGVAVNDSLVLIDCINKNLKSMPLKEALIDASQRRMRPILLTSITTVVGMTPVLFESSAQAKFLIPMVTSLVFGISFATLLILILIPVCYKVIAGKT